LGGERVLGSHRDAAPFRLGQDGVDLQHKRIDIGRRLGHYEVAPSRY
jgi:hypothetical protein